MKRIHILQNGRSTRRGQRWSLLRTVTTQTAVSAVTALALAGCVGSEKPLLAGGKPVVGPMFAARLFRDFSEEKARDQRRATFRWQGGIYKRDTGSASVASFVAEPLEGNDYLIQSSNEDRHLFLYWIGRRLTDGAYLIFPLDETNAADRKATCAANQPQDVCVVETKEKLIELARATAERPVKDAEIAVIVDDGLSTKPHVPAGQPKGRGQN